MPSYLTKREGTYYFRRVVPEELRPIIGKREFFWSLRTKSLAEAKKARNLAAIKTDREIERAVSRAPVSTEQFVPFGAMTTDASIRQEAARVAANLRKYLSEGLSG